MKIITATGKEYEIAWLGFASIDNALRFNLIGESLNNVVQIFTKPSETSTLVYNMDGVLETYSGFTVFRSIDVLANGSITVALGRT